MENFLEIKNRPTTTLQAKKSIEKRILLDTVGFAGKADADLANKFAEASEECITEIIFEIPKTVCDLTSSSNLGSGEDQIR